MHSLRTRTFLLFLLIALPFGAYNGFVSFALGSLARSAGLSVGDASRIIALCALPFGIGNLLGPVVDFGLTRRVWLILCSLAGASLLGLSLAIPLASHTGLFSACVIGAGFLLIISQAAGGALIAISTPLHQKGVAGSWNMAGSLTGAIIGSALTLTLLRSMQVELGAALLALIFFMPALGALGIPDPPRHAAQGESERLREMLVELKTTISDPYRLTGLIIFLSPAPCQAASNLFTAIAPDYGTSERAVALITGVGGNLLGLLGCVIAGLVCDRLDRRYAYLASGLYLGACGVALLLARPSPLAYTILTSLYMIGAGYAVAAAYALAFDLGGGGALTAGTRIALYTGAMALAIFYCTITEGWMYDHLGRRGMFALDAGFNLAGGSAMALILKWFGGLQNRAAPVVDLSRT